jgi:hypothetical protein
MPAPFWGSAAPSLKYGFAALNRGASVDKKTVIQLFNVGSARAAAPCLGRSCQNRL